MIRWTRLATPLEFRQSRKRLWLRTRVRLRRSVLLALLIIATMNAAPATPAARAAFASMPAICDLTGGTGRLAGQVTAVGAPLNGASLTLYREDGRYAGGATSSGAAAYAFNNLRAGRYLLFARPPSNDPHLAPAWYNGQTDPLTATPITVLEGATTTVNIQLTNGAAVTGSVHKPDGTPLANATVSVTTADGVTMAQAVSSLSGDFTTVPGLAVGAYRVVAAPPSGQPYVVEYYADQADLDHATPITITAPNQIVNVGMLTLDLSVSVAGRVTQALTNAPLQAAVTIRGDGGYASTITDAEGRYILNANLRSGAYILTVQQKTASDNLIAVSRNLVFSAGEARTGVDVALSHGGQMTGRVTDTGGAPIPSVYVQAWKKNTYESFSRITDAAGRYTFTGLESGDYEVSFEASGYVAEAFDDRPVDTPDLVHVTAPNTISGIDAVLGFGGMISGTVTAADTGLPLEGVSVSAQGAGSNDFGNGETDAAGHYVVTGLATGDYRLRFYPAYTGPSCAYQPEWYGDARSYEQSTLIAVSAPGSVAGIDAALERGSVLSGRIVASDTGAPLSYSFATVYDLAGQPVASGSGNFLGHFITSPGLPSGAYHVRFSDGNSGYVDEFYNDSLTAMDAAPVNVTAGTDVDGLNAALSLGGSISGRVTAADSGVGLSDVQVFVHDAAGNLWGDTTTAADGSYQVRDGLPSGQYAVTFEYFGPALPPSMPAPQAQSRATPPDAKAVTSWPFDLDTMLVRGVGALENVAQAILGSPYAPQVYNNQRTRTEADLVSVTAPNDTTGVDATLSYGVYLPIIRH